MRVQEFSIRRGSGGAGRHRGGDGVIRRLEFLRPLELSLLANAAGPIRPTEWPAASPGRSVAIELIHPDGTSETLPGIAQLSVAAGDILVIETPGGGGFGELIASQAITHSHTLAQRIGYGNG